MVGAGAVGWGRSWEPGTGGTGAWGRRHRGLGGAWGRPRVGLGLGAEPRVRSGARPGAAGGPGRTGPGITV